MILEVAVLDIKLGRQADFEQVFAKAKELLTSARGYISHQLKNSLEKDNRYILLVSWETLEDHTEGFRGSEDYQKWKSLLHDFYDPFPEVEHYR